MVATSSRVRVSRDTRALMRNMCDLSPTTQGTQIEVRDDLTAKYLLLSFFTDSDRRQTSPLESVPKAFRNLSWKPRQKNQNPFERKKVKVCGSLPSAHLQHGEEHGMQNHMDSEPRHSPSAEHVSCVTLTVETSFSLSPVSSSCSSLCKFLCPNKGNMFEGSAPSSVFCKSE